MTIQFFRVYYADVTPASDPPAAIRAAAENTAAMVHPGTTCTFYTRDGISVSPVNRSSKEWKVVISPSQQEGR